MTQRAFSFLACWIGLLLVSGGCSLAPHPRNESGDPDLRLARALDRLAAPPDAEPPEGAFLDPGRLRNDVSRLALEFPDHVPILLANASLEREAGEPERAEAYLDRVLRLEPDHARAGVLRGVLALERGNVPYARSLLERLVQRRPDDPALRETYAAALMADGDLEGAGSELDHALRLGAPPHRVWYNRGLLAELAGDPDGARSLYERSLSADPGFAPAQRRSKGLR